MDITGNSVDTEAEKFLATLRDTLLPEKIAESNVGRFEVEWSGREGLDKETHTEYLTEFCENFHSRITELVDRAVVAKEKLCSDAMYSETLQHLHMCNTFCKLFQVCWNSTPSIIIINHENMLWFIFTCIMTVESIKMS